MVINTYFKNTKILNSFSEKIKKPKKINLGLFLRRSYNSSKQKNL